MKELLAKGVIEELGTDEEVEINGGILEVAEICNQNHFSGMNNLNLWLLLCTNAIMCRSDNLEASLPLWPALASRGACLTSSIARSFEKRVSSYKARGKYHNIWVGDVHFLNNAMFYRCLKIKTSSKRCVLAMFLVKKMFTEHVRPV